MQIDRQMAYEAWRRCGNFALAAEELGTTQSNMRARVRSYYKHHGLDIRELEIAHQVSVISARCKRRYKYLRMMVHQPCYALGVAVFDIDGELVFAAPDKYDAENLIGIYDKDGCHDDMREDLYWYVTNVMEAKE